MIQTFKKLILSALLLFSATPLFATHVAGGNISYLCTGVPNQFLITLTVFRDCGGAGLGGTETIRIKNDCNVNFDTTIIAPRISVEEVSQICTASLPNTECNNPPGTLAGTEKHVYQVLYTFPYVCDAWTLSYRRCNRNTLVNIVNSDAECFYVESKLYSATQACNTSPTINSQPIPYACINQPVNYDFSVLELDGDSLTYELVSALDDAGVPLEYDTANGYFDSIPIPGITVNPNTGQINFTPATVGNFGVVLLIKEYNQCGDLVGSLMHDIQFVIENCTNTVPQVVTTPTTITNFNNFGTNAQLVGDNQIKLCTGDQFCFNVSFDDGDAADIVQLSSNVANFLPGATFTSVDGNPAVATVCWTYQQGYTGSIISINATDDKCDVPGFATYAIDLDVPPAVFPGEDSTFNLCGSEGTINLFDYLGGYYQNDGVWKFNGNVISNFQDVTTMSAGTYYYVVLPDTAGASACGAPTNPCVEADSSKLTIGMADLQVFYDPANVSNENCDATFDGACSIGPITGNFGPFDVVWNSPYNGVHATQTVNSGGSASQTNLYNDESGPAPWLVTVTDTNGCQWQQTFTILEGQLEIVPIINSPLCYGEGGASIVITLANGDTTATDFYITNVAGDTLNEDPGNPGNYLSVANNLFAGTYIVYAEDDFGCESVNQFTIPEPFSGPMSVALNVFEPDCHQTAKGIISVVDIFNTASDIEDVAFTWTPLPNGNSNGLGKTTITNCLPGNYLIEFLDENGCDGDTLITIEDKDPLTAHLFVNRPTACRTAGYQSGSGVVYAFSPNDSSGTGTPTFTWEHLGTGAKSNNSTWTVRDPGYIQLTVTDALGCKFKDTIYLDSINPVADFTLASDQFYVDNKYEGDEALKVTLTNLSYDFGQVGNNNSDTVFQINFNTTDVNNGSKWFFTFDLDERADTTYMGVNLNEPTVYQVCLIAKNFNNCSDTLCKDVTVHRLPELTLPNVFTPGTIPNNEFFFPAVGYKEFHADVFNRYGVRVFEFNDVTDKWDGNHYKSGSPCTDGVYSYTYTARTSNGTPVNGDGQIHLIRHKP